MQRVSHFISSTRSIAYSCGEIEHVTAVTVSIKDKLTLSLGVAVGSSIQIALFVIPFIITLGWILNKPLTLLFDPLESIVLFLAVLTVNYAVQDGKSNCARFFPFITILSADDIFSRARGNDSHVSLSHPCCHFLVLPRF